MDRSICPDIHWCYRLYYKCRRAPDPIGPSVGPIVYAEQQINAAEESLHQCVSDWTMRIRHSPDMFLPVIERLVSASQQVNR